MWYSLLFSPLQKEYYCNLFLVLSICGFVFLCLGSFLFVYGVYQNYGNAYLTKTAMGIGLYFVFYLQNRLLHSICTKTIS